MGNTVNLGDQVHFNRSSSMQYTNLVYSDLNLSMETFFHKNCVQQGEFWVHRRDLLKNEFFEAEAMLMFGFRPEELLSGRLMHLNQYNKINDYLAEAVTRRVESLAKAKNSLKTDDSGPLELDVDDLKRALVSAVKEVNRRVYFLEFKQHQNSTIETGFVLLLYKRKLICYTMKGVCVVLVDKEKNGFEIFRQNLDGLGGLEGIGGGFRGLRAGSRLNFSRESVLRERDVDWESGLNVINLDEGVGLKDGGDPSLTLLCLPKPICDRIGPEKAVNLYLKFDCDFEKFKQAVMLFCLNNVRTQTMVRKSEGNHLIHEALDLYFSNNLKKGQNNGLGTPRAGLGRGIGRLSDPGFINCACVHISLLNDQKIEEVKNEDPSEVVDAGEASLERLEEMIKGLQNDQL